MISGKDLNMKKYQSKSLFPFNPFFLLPPPSSMGMAATLRLIYRENGVTRGLYRGMSINYMRAIPMVAVSFSTYEITKQVLGLDTGLRIKTG